MTIYGSHYFRAKFLKKSISNKNLKKVVNPQAFCLVLFLLQAFFTNTFLCVLFMVKCVKKKVWECGLHEVVKNLLYCFHQMHTVFIFLKPICSTVTPPPQAVENGVVLSEILCCHFVYIYAIICLKYIQNPHFQAILKVPISAL